MFIKLDAFITKRWIIIWKIEIGEVCGIDLWYIKISLVVVFENLSFKETYESADIEKIWLVVKSTEIIRREIIIIRNRSGII